MNSDKLRKTEEITEQSTESVSGGVLPFIVAVVAFDIGLISTMAIVQSSMGEK
uniref:hypothetical protein n=1 Tax=Ningiella ruwaisensis TaxID=2364274 RepID=UPI0014469406|nr:hypothetical protein [Ningiella ruwaisensis]